MINHFTLFNIHTLNIDTWEFESQGEMRAYEARKFIYEMEKRQIPTMVESAAGSDEQDLSFFMDYCCEDLESEIYSEDV